jgi:Arc/MetJ-type ribon-helix-helix transcriptional regulator
MYGEPRKTTTISVKLGDDDLKLLDALVADREFAQTGMPDARENGYWFTPKRSHAVRAAIRAAAADKKPGSAKAKGRKG